MGSDLNNFIFEGTKFLPSIKFYSDGQLSISGRIIPDHVTDFFMPLNEWLKKLHSDFVRFEVNIEYINTWGLREIMNLFNSISDNENISKVMAIWYYEEEDEEHREKGTIIAERFPEIKFKFASYL